MEYMSENDTFYVSSASILTDYDRGVLCDLYQPIIGSIATSLFFTLWSKIDSNGPLSSLFSIMQVNTNQLLDARKKLEAIGLMKTYAHKDENSQSFLFLLFSPKQPRDFFNDEIFSLLLRKNIGNEEEIQRLKSKYSDNISCLIDEFKERGYEEISAHFKDVFSPDMNNIKYTPTRVRNIKRRRLGSMVLDFDIGVFFKNCHEKAFVTKDFFSDDEILAIKKVSLVYGIDEEQMSVFVINHLNNDLPKGSRVDFDGLIGELNKWNSNDFVKKTKSKESPKTENLDKLINLMDNSSPMYFLMLLQNGANVAPADGKLINRLSSYFGLPNGVINALLSYVLKVKHNTLPSSYTEKIAASLLREGVTNAYETMNYLNQTHSKLKNKSKQDNENKDSEEDEFSTPEYDLSSLDE